MKCEGDDDNEVLGARAIEGSLLLSSLTIEDGVAGVRVIKSVSFHNKL